ncbi:MAG: alcohol dehydrogenase catalytic domain-containing protein [Pseudomonadota bacterium]
MKPERSTMRAVVFDGELRFVKDYPLPQIPPDWVLIRVLQAGICGTDLELIKGYMGFSGILGHEFIGIVHQSDDPGWLGQRVAGEINAACGCEKRFRICPWSV